MQEKKKNRKPERVTKPFMRGKMIDRTLPGAALKFFAFMFMMIFVYLMSMVLSTLENRLITIVINAAILAATWLLFWQSGMSSGADAVAQGEIMLARREKGRPVEDWEAERCYHPLKGFIVALVGSIPLLVCSVILACIAKRQMTPIGVLPTWVNAFETRQEIGGALAYYHQEAGLTLETVMRLIVHLATMPFVGIVGADNWDGVLMLERFSPLANLLPAVAFGIGYAMGTHERAAVHTNVALGKQNLRKKQARERRQRQKQNQVRRGPEQLN